MTNSLRNSQTVNWPNILTVLRIFMAIGVIWLGLGFDSFLARILAGVVFTVAALTDFVDGRLARRWDAITNFGKIADPIADKLLVLGTFAVFAILGLYSFWLIVPILIREITITLLRFYFLAKGVAVAAVKSGKQKTATQITAIAIIYLNFLFRKDIAPRMATDTAATLQWVFDGLMFLGLAAALYITLYSGYIFFKNNWRLLRP